MKIKLYTLIIFILLFYSHSLYATNNSDPNISWDWLLAWLLGGLSMFLYGMEKMSNGLKRSAGEKMRNILSTLTRNRFIGLFVGVFVTMIIQSSSATTVMLVSFTQAGLMNFAQTLSIILGANIGSTFTAQLIAFKLTDYAIVMIAVGFMLSVISKKETLKNIGDTLLGFGILFYGMKLMSDAMSPLREYPQFIAIIKSMENPLLGVLVGALFTAIIQSSGAFTGIIIVLAQQNLISLEAGIPLIMGANIGTCATAALASLGASRNAKRVAIAHAFYNIGGVLLFMFIIPYFAQFIRVIETYTGGGIARQIANAHTVFNLGVALFFIIFTRLTAKLITKILPDKIQQIKDSSPTLLEQSMIETPNLALKIARTQIAHMSKILGEMLDNILIPFVTKRDNNGKFPDADNIIKTLDNNENRIDQMEEEVMSFLLKLGQQQLTKKEINELLGMISIVNNMEAIGDIIHRNLVPQISKKQRLTKDFSEEGKEEILKFKKKTRKQIDRLQKALLEEKTAEAQKVVEKEKTYNELEAEYRTRHIKRVQQGNKDSLETHEIHMELMDHLKQINLYVANIARTITSTTNFA